ncbi:Hsp20/alpha crystallin family protein [Candidatus Woesearchaeota archaeon]|nr:Hsp20/alpha crystallin family protein [Candidatus Woesearchaeota archaeon]
MFRSNIFDEFEKEFSNRCVAIMKRPELEAVSRIPVADIVETESSVIATFELPGVEKEDIRLNVTDDRIEVKVEKKAENKVEDKESYSYEMRSQSFYSALPLPAEVAAENADASYKNEILKVEIPKANKAEAKRIEIK